MDILEYTILNVGEIHDGSRLTKVFLTTDTYGFGREEKWWYFYSHKWPDIEKSGRFNEFDYLSKSKAATILSMTDDEWGVLRYNKPLSEYTDEEIITEFNRRRRSFNNKIQIEVTVSLKD